MCRCHRLKYNRGRGQPGASLRRPISSMKSLGSRPVSISASSTPITASRHACASASAGANRYDSVIEQVLQRAAELLRRDHLKMLLEQRIDLGRADRLERRDRDHLGRRRAALECLDRVPAQPAQPFRHQRHQRAGERDLLVGPLELGRADILLQHEEP